MQLYFGCQYLLFSGNLLHLFTEMMQTAVYIIQSFVSCHELLMQMILRGNVYCRDFRNLLPSIGKPASSEIPYLAVCVNKCRLPLFQRPDTLPYVSVP